MLRTKDVYYLVVHLCDLTYHRCLADPLPMKQRALPQSFWQQPNKANPQPPGVVYSNLPPLPLGGDEASEITPVEEVSNGSTGAPHAIVASSHTQVREIGLVSVSSTVPVI